MAGFDDDGLQRRQHTLAVGLAERHEARASEIQFDMTAWKNACMVGASGPPWAALTRPTATG